MTKNDIKFARALSQKKFRHESQCFIVEGIKLVREAIDSNWPIQALYTTDNEFLSAHVKAQKISSSEMQQISQLHTPSAHFAILKQMDRTFDLSQRPKIAVLDGISDPGNMGTILRTADWFGIRHLCCTNHCVEITNPKVVQATMGSIFRTHIVHWDAPELIEQLKQHRYEMVGAVLQGESMYAIELQAHHALVIGSESHGISPVLMDALSKRVTIPGAPGAESLNASIAAGILLSEFYRQNPSI